MKGSNGEKKNDVFMRYRASFPLDANARQDAEEDCSRERRRRSSSNNCHGEKWHVLGRMTTVTFYLLAALRLY